MKILGKVKIKGYNIEGLLLDCREEETLYSSMDNLVDNQFMMLLHNNTRHLNGYIPSYINKFKRAFGYTRSYYVNKSFYRDYVEYTFEKQTFKLKIL